MTENTPFRTAVFKPAVTEYINNDIGLIVENVVLSSKKSTNSQIHTTLTDDEEGDESFT